MASPQPLALLRDYTCQNKPITLLDENEKPVASVADAAIMAFDNHRFPRQTATHLKKSASSHDTYTLDTLLFLIQNATVDNSAYFKECRAHKMEHVSIVDKKKILDYLTGKIDTLPNLEEAGTPEKRARDEAAVTTASKKAKVAPLKAHDDLVKEVLGRERELVTRSSILRGTKNFENAAILVSKLVLNKDIAPRSSTMGKPGAAPLSSQRPTMPSRSTSSSHNKAHKLSKQDKIPLIIVPAAVTAKFTLYNIKQFLENQQFVDATQMREEGLKKPDRVTIERRKPNGQIVPYHVVDSVAGFKPTDWDRVCCVFVAGQQWQFKGWKWEKPVDLFSNVKGFYPKWSSDETNSTVSKWAVTELKIHRHKRHMDKAVVSQFWDDLDSYIATHKPYLNF
ncbi:RNA pol II accessory factor, Cdc73 family-domain-containing protein [Radiomyces spectabilis]|uniref:RNA pol II accessory factor, Cdc73 family-domain-containing protein n=1 Tax=Radiomyces spectabilis TaxID=64574 RepID=UPI0022208205|nr:RNA pol II accessory factor, Cdc73 family-domain-containing protein [Radiomyces spectabilis]KAI8388093.1 RNA pol II accessory factor, Cdc73 family-domain-containing protein [Radiomyces spectabilis]